jgi:hypothetical protein
VKSENIAEALWVGPTLPECKGETPADGIKDIHRKSRLIELNEITSVLVPGNRKRLYIKDDVYGAGECNILSGLG